MAIHANPNADHNVNYNARIELPTAELERSKMVHFQATDRTPHWKP
ncbi:MAG: hypothetical protein Hyperionvirus4_12 [Hyperionvirus sp.]|uniref:Uncharacterized protein n=1 Tax=Hyperionvirus sp. TaxID=2487770 RepID=A0A3G5A731_9VIRU|nr:MAG: hypothetical protein Hyperionvirus4_12 [Hyperionvirus sp.]